MSARKEKLRNSYNHIWENLEWLWNYSYSMVIAENIIKSNLNIMPLNDDSFQIKTSFDRNSDSKYSIIVLYT